MTSDEIGARAIRKRMAMGEPVSKEEILYAVMYAPPYNPDEEARDRANARLVKHLGKAALIGAAILLVATCLYLVRGE